MGPGYREPDTHYGDIVSSAMCLYFILTAVSVQDQVAEVLRKAGVSVVTTAVCNVAAFLAAALIPIPALRAFCFQAALLTVFNLLSMMILFPAIAQYLI